MQLPDINRSVLRPLHKEEWEERKLEVFVKQDDRIHSDISGNKWRKLVYNMEKAQLQKNENLITFGGAFSNHLLATAAACRLYGIHSIGFVRGDELSADSNETLRKCTQLGMELHFLSRSEYLLKTDELWLKELHVDFPNSYLVPEGGANYLGIAGCQDMIRELPEHIDRIFVAQGTTTTSCGILLGTSEKTKVHVVPVLKGFHAEDEMRKLFTLSGIDDELQDDLFQRMIVENSYDFGGYGKYTPALLQFIQTVYQKLHLKLDPIYTGKAFFAMEEVIRKMNIQNERIIFIHTGGLQGIAGVERKEKIRFFE